MMVHIRRYTVELIERIKPLGRCNFAKDVAYLLPTPGVHPSRRSAARLSGGARMADRGAP